MDEATEEVYGMLRELTWTVPSRPLASPRQFLFVEQGSVPIDRLLESRIHRDNRFMFDEFQGCRVYLGRHPRFSVVIVLEDITDDSNKVPLSVLGNFIDLNELKVDVSCLAVSAKERKVEVDEEVRFLQRFGVTF